jgi:hypothetical protein
MLTDLAAVCMFLITVYAQWSLSRATNGWRHTWMTRILLVLVGTLVGWLAIVYTPAQADASALALFLIGFGQTHVPAAIVLLFKAQRSARVS